MATITKRGSGFQLRITHKLLPKPLYATFGSEVAASNYGKQLEALLSQGVVPHQDLLSIPKAADDRLLTQLIADYCERFPALTDSDDALLGLVMRDKPVVGMRLSALTYRWAESYVAWLKSAEMNLAPSSIRKRVGVLGRVMDWHIKQTTPDNVTPQANVLRLLPRGYSNYSKVDAMPRRDTSRDRRLSPEEAQRIEVVLDRVKRDDRERIYTNDESFMLLYRLIVDTGLRLFEAFRLRVESVDLAKNILKVEGSKGHRGAIKPRVVPIKQHLREPLRQHCAGRVGLLFHYWDGSRDEQPKTSSKLSRRFSNLFEYAQVPDFTEHDLRHEACCRWFELRNDKGHWVFSDIEICKIMGWHDTRMALRYASIRGEDLSERLG